MNSSINQGVNIALGLQKSFSWREVAISGLSTAASNEVWQRVADGVYGQTNSAGWAKAAANVSSAITSALVRRSLGGRMDTDAVLADVFGNALGNSIVDRMQPSTRPTGAGSQAGSGGSSAGAVSSVDQIEEVQVTARRRLDNNPTSSVYQPVAVLTPDEMRAVAVGRPAPIEEVVVTAPQWRLGEELIYEQLVTSSMFGGERYQSEDYAAARAQDIYRGSSTYREGFVARAGVLSNALHVTQGYVKNTYDSAVAEFSSSNNSWFNRGVNLVGATAMFPLAMAEELGRGVLNIPSAFVGAIPLADQAGGQFGVAFDPTQPTDARVVGALGGIRDTAFAFTGLGTPAAAFTGGVSAAPLTAEQRALQGLQGAEATAAALATYRGELGKTLGRYSAVEPGPLAADLAGTFAGGRYRVVELEQDTVLYRAGTADRPLGQFFSQEPPRSIVQTRIDKAVLPEWPGGGKSPLDTSFAVKIPQGTRVYVGEVGSQGGFYVGGTQQIVVVKPWAIRSVEVIESRPLR